MANMTSRGDIIPTAFGPAADLEHALRFAEYPVSIEEVTRVYRNEHGVIYGLDVYGGIQTAEVSRVVRDSATNAITATVRRTERIQSER